MIKYINLFSFLEVASSPEQTSEKKEIDADVRSVAEEENELKSVEEITPERRTHEMELAHALGEDEAAK
jgi:hypothetical protein